MMMFWSHIFSAAALGVASLSGISAIDTVDKLIVDKYLGRWYQVSNRKSLDDKVHNIVLIMDTVSVG